MAKKLTKAQLKEIESKERTLRNSRRYFVEAVKSYWKDVEAVKRYYKINNISDKTDYYGDLSDEETQELLNRYDVLKNLDLKTNYDRDDLEAHTWTILRFIIRTEEHKDSRYMVESDEKFEEDLLQDDIYVNDILWGEKDVDLLIKYMKEFGYKRIQYFNHSSGVAEELYYFINKGCNIVGTNALLMKYWKGEDYRVDKTGIIIELPE